MTEYSITDETGQKLGETTDPQAAADAFIALSGGRESTITLYRHIGGVTEPLAIAPAKNATHTEG